MKITKEKCLEELEKSRLLTATVINQDGYTEYSCDFEQTSIFDTFEQLINEHFDNVEENTIEFKSFHLLADNTLKSWSKDALLDYIHTLYHNWKNADISYDNVMDYANKLQEELDKLEEQHMKLLSQWGKTDNPPLKFEELKEIEREPIWDNKLKSYRLIKHIGSDWLLTVRHDGTDDYVKFEENRFYRDEVDGDVAYPILIDKSGTKYYFRKNEV